MTPKKAEIETILKSNLFLIGDMGMTRIGAYICILQTIYMLRQFGKFFFKFFYVFSITNHKIGTIVPCIVPKESMAEGPRQHYLNELSRYKQENNKNKYTKNRKHDPKTYKWSTEHIPEMLIKTFPIQNARITFV